MAQEEIAYDELPKGFTIKEQDTYDELPPGFKVVRPSIVPQQLTDKNPKSTMQRVQEAFPETHAKELQNMSDAIVRSNAYKIPVDKAFDGNGILRAMEAGFNMSVTGLATVNKLDNYEPTGTVEELAQMGAGFVGDLPAIIVGYFAGGGQLTGVGGAFALPMGIRKVYMDRLNKGEITGPSDFVDRLKGAMVETAKGEATGLATGAAGKFLPYGLKTIGEIGTMTTVGSLLEGQVPSLKDFVNAAMFVGTLKGTAKVQQFARNKMMVRYNETGERPYELAKKLNEAIPEKTWSLPETEQMKALEKAFDEVADQPVIENLGKNVIDDLGLKNILKETWTGDEAVTHPRGEVIKQRPLGKRDEGRFAPEIRERDLSDLKTDADISSKDLGSYTTPIRVFEKIPFIKRLFYDKMDAADVKRVEATKYMEGFITDLFKDVSKDSDKAIREYAYSKQENGQRLLDHTHKTEGYKPRDLNEHEMKVYNTLRDEFKNFYQQIQAARAKAGAKPFAETSDYFTFFQNAGIMERMGLDILKTDSEHISKSMDLLNTEIFKPKTTPFRFAKDRVKAVYQVSDSAKVDFMKYVNSAYKHIFLSPEIAQMREYMLKIGKGDEAFSMKDDKPNTFAFLNRWLNEQAGIKDSWVKKKFGSEWDDRLAALNSNITVATLSMSIRSFLIQPTSILNSANYLGIKYAHRGIMGLLSGEGKTAMDKSNLVTREYDVAVAEALSGLTGIKNTLADKGMFMLKYLDMQTAKATWLGAYEKGKDFYKMKEPDAVRFANDTVVKTQASARSIDKAPIQYDNLGKALTLFQTFVINDFNFIKSDVLGIRNKDISKSQAIKNAMGIITGMTMINILFEDVLGINSPYPTPLNVFNNALDKGDSPLGASWAAAMEMGSMVPTIGGGLRYGGSGLGGTPDFIKDTVEFAAGRPFAKPWWEIGGKALGVPGIVQLKKVIKGEDVKEMTLGRSPQ